MGTRTRILTYFVSILIISLVFYYVSLRTLSHLITRETRGNASNTPKHYRNKAVNARLIVLTRNRARSLSRLLDSAANASYGTDGVDIDIWIDRIQHHLPTDPEVLCVSQNLVWPHGKKVIHQRRKRVGLYQQWLYTWDLTNPLTDEFAIILEDDLELAPTYYQWLKEARRRYDNDPQIGGYTLQRLRYRPRAPRANQRVLHVPRGVHAFKYRMQGSWGTAPKRDVWLKFRRWYEAQRRIGAKPYMRNFAGTTLYRRGENADGFNPTVWTQWYHKFADEMGYFSVVAHPPGRATLCANWREAGSHYNGTTMKPDYPLYNGNVSSFNWPDTLLSLDWDGTIINRTS